MTLSSAADQLNDLRRVIGRSRAAIADGSIVELDGLDAEVMRITDIAKNASSAERSSVLTAMDALLQELDGLTADLRRQHDAGLARQAAGAYRPEPGMS